MLSEDTNDKTVNLAVRTSKITGNALKFIIKKLLAELNKKDKPGQLDTEKEKHGRTTLKSCRRKMTGLHRLSLVIRICVCLIKS